ncbi:MAG: hemolysin family protein [Byssovorax sp.]
MSPLPFPWPMLAAAGVSTFVGSLFSAADTAVISLSAPHLGALIEQSSGAKRKAYERIQAEEAKLHSRYLVGRIASTALTSVCLYLVFDALLGSLAPYFAFGVTLGFNALLFEVVTSLARKHADVLSAIAARFLLPLELLMLPLAAPLGWLGDRLSRKKEGEQPVDPKVTEAEVEALVEEGERTGLFGREPAAMIRNVLEFADRTAKDVMVPRAQVEGIEIGTPLEKVLEIVSQSGHSRYPVYREQIDNISGLLYAKDLFKVLEEHRVRNTDLKEIIRHPANFVAESQPLATLLKEMRGRRQHLAIVVDEFGGVSGIVTLEDVLEEIVGDIRDEHDDSDEEAHIEDLGDGRMVADATVTLRELSAFLGTEIDPDADDESLGAMLTHHVGKVPEAGTAVSKYGLHFIVRESDEIEVQKVEILRTPRAASA